MLGNLKIRSKMVLVVLLPLIALVALVLVGARTLRAVQIGSERYEELVKSQDLVADILPPPAFLIQAHLLTEELAAEGDPVVRGVLITQLASTEVEYLARRQYWQQTLIHDDEADVAAALEAAFEAGEEFWRVVDTQLVPAANVGDLATMSRVDATVINPAFERHESLINTTIDLARASAKSLEAEAADAVASEKRLALLLAFAAGIVTLALTYLLARSIIGPIRRLTESAAAAEAQLPTIVARAQAGDEAGLAAVNETGSPEFVSLASAMNSMQTTAVNLATEQARVRRNVSIMLGNLARRNQSLVNRTLSFITELEKDERNPETLDNLFKLDHLTTRMRRNAESLLVLSGAEQARSWPRPVEIREVMRASLSEIEAYDRVELASLDPVLIRGSSVADLTHLVAELLDNATRFSPGETTVTVSGEQSGDGYILSIVDRGMGMSPEALAQANRELESLSRLEERTSLVLGLAVVGRLGARNGIVVRLERGAGDGVVAKVRLPGSVLHRSTPVAPAVSAPVAARVQRSDVAVSPPALGTSTRAAAESAIARRDESSFPAPSTPSVLPPVAPAGSPPDRRRAPVAPSAGAEPGALHVDASDHRSLERAAANRAASERAASERAASERAAAERAAAERAATERLTAQRAEADRVAAERVAAERAVADRLAAAATPDSQGAARDITTPNGLARRVPGANLFDGSLPPPLPAPPVRRTAESVRDALSNYQDGFQRAPRRRPEPESEREDDR